MQVPVPVYTTEKVASVWPSSGRKKNWMPRLAWSLVSMVGFVGLSAGDPVAVAVNVFIARLTRTVEEIASPEKGRRGVTKCSKTGTVSRSM